MPTDSIRPFLLRHPVSAGTHLLFCLWAIYAAALLRRLCRDDPLRQRSISIFGGGMVLLYGISGIYHAIPADHPALIRLFLRLDLAAIHLLIAATLTPVFAVLLRGRLRVGLLSVVWVTTLAGMAVKGFLPLPSVSLTIGLYALSAAVGLLPVVPLTRAVGPRGMTWFVAGALVYAAGAVCQASGRPTLVPGIIGPHEILHICDMAGTLCHLVFIMRFVLGVQGTA